MKGRNITAETVTDFQSYLREEEKSNATMGLKKTLLNLPTFSATVVLTPLAFTSFQRALSIVGM